MKEFFSFAEFWKKRKEFVDISNSNLFCKPNESSQKKILNSLVRDWIKGRTLTSDKGLDSHSIMLSSGKITRRYTSQCEKELALLSREEAFGIVCLYELMERELRQDIYEVLSYLGYDFIFLICHFVILLYECSITNKQFEEILEQNDIRATKLIKLIIEKYNKENLFKEIEGSENNYNVIEMCNNILEKNKLIGEENSSAEENNLFKEKAKGPSNMLDELRKKLGFVDKSTETSYEDSLSIENKLTKNLFDISEPSNKNGLNVNMERAGGSSSSEELF